MRLPLLVVLALVMLPLRYAHAEPFLPGGALDQTMVSDVATTALAFMAPRTLQAIPLSRLSLWGLRGLSTLDPRLEPEFGGGELRLSLIDGPAPRLLLARRVPEPPAGAAPDAASDIASWGAILAEMVRAAWDASQAVRHVGTDGVIEVFFDEICNHLDPYSRYATPAEAQPERDLRAGVGLEVEPGRHGYVVSSIAPDGPAAAAGVRRGEVLLAIDDQTLTEAMQGDVAAMLAGPEDSAVVLRLRGRGGRARDVTLNRAVLFPQTVRARQMGRLALLQISSFAPDTASKLAEAITAIAPAATPAATAAHRPGPGGVVVDLRGNRGGLLREAVAAAETLLTQGVVATTIGRDPAADHRFEAAGQDLAHGLPVVVLVDGGSASAAEILAAALADQHRAVVVGSSTVGKGLVQAVQNLPNRGELLLTWSRVLAPLGWPIQGLGVLPQVCTSLGPDAVSAQLEALDQGEQPMADTLARHRAAREPVSSEETLALRDACPAAEGRDGDLAAARFLIEHPAAYAAAQLGPPPSPAELPQTVP